MQVFKDAFKLRDTHGFPLVSSLDACADLGALCSLPHFVRDAVRAGWSQGKIRAEVHSAVLDRDGREAADRIDALVAVQLEHSIDPDWLLAWSYTRIYGTQERQPSASADAG